MNKLINELTEEHKIISNTLKHILDKGILSNESKNDIFEVKTILLKHINIEDEKLYPILYQASKSDTDLKKTLDFFVSDMGEISNFVMRFFSKYETDTNGADFIKDLVSIISKLEQRIYQEETILYKKFEEI